MSSAPRDTTELDDLLSEPGQGAVAALAACPGDVIVLGAGGKMGPTLARMVARAARDRRVIAVSRFSSALAMDALEAAGVETVRCDLLNRAEVDRLPHAPNVFFMAGQKFGTTDAPERTWALNVTVPGFCADRYSTSRIVAFSTGNVYPLVPVDGGGATESDATGPIGTYAESCFAREQVFASAARRGTRVAIMRLNYAVALTYGVLTDIAVKVAAGQPISLAMGFVNVIWQGDANRAAIELLARAASPACIVNVTGDQTLRVRSLALGLGERLGRAPVFADEEPRDALLSSASLMQTLLSPPLVALNTMLDWTADWVSAGRLLLGKPTGFDVRDGKF